MLTIQLHIRAAWDDYFTGSKTNYNSQTYTSKPTLSGTSVYVSNCLFRSFTSGSDGGALYFTSVMYLLIESTSFFSCKTSSDEGGAIYFSNSNGQCVLHEVCGYDCCSTYTSYSYYQFAYIYVNNAASSKNYMNYSSIVRCVNLRSDSYYTLRLSCGKICCPSVNISMNKCQLYSGILFQPSIVSNTVTGSLSYCSITDNFANGHTCIHPWNGGSNCEIKSCNILRNSQGSLSSTGTFYAYDNVKIADSCILGNQATYIFYAHVYTITVSNCTLDSTSKTGNVVIQDTVTKSFIHALNHISTQNCHSSYDSAGYLTPNIETPSPSKKQMPCFTFCNCFYQPQLSDFFSLANVFVFNFICPYASVDFWYYS
jgi:hypothetical protein